MTENTTILTDSSNHDAAIQTIKNARWVRSDKTLPANADFYSARDPNGSVRAALDELGYNNTGICGDGTNSYRAASSSFAASGHAMSEHSVRISPQAKFFLDAECKCDIAAQPSGRLQQAGQISGAQGAQVSRD